MTQAPLSSWEPKGVTSQGKASDKGTHSRGQGGPGNTKSSVPRDRGSSTTPTLHTLATHHLLLSWWPQTSIHTVENVGGTEEKGEDGETLPLTHLGSFLGSLPLSVWVFCKALSEKGQEGKFSAENKACRGPGWCVAPLQAAWGALTPPPPLLPCRSCQPLSMPAVAPPRGRPGGQPVLNGDTAPHTCVDKPCPQVPEPPSSTRPPLPLPLPPPCRRSP